MAAKRAALSPRLQAIAGLVSPGKKLIDIGTDHAFLPIRLVADGLVPAALAVDIGEGPLAIAGENIEKAGLSDRIETVLSDGFSKVSVSGGESCVIAGMGGGTTMGILSAAAPSVAALSELILEPQSRITDVRNFLVESGFEITDERLVADSGKYYQVMKCVYSGKKSSLTPAQAAYGPVLLQRKDPLLLTLIQKNLEELSTIVDGLVEAGGIMGMNEARKAALKGNRARARMMRDALSYYL